MVVCLLLSLTFVVKFLKWESLFFPLTCFFQKIINHLKTKTKTWRLSCDCDFSPSHYENAVSLVKLHIFQIKKSLTHDLKKHSQITLYKHHCVNVCSQKTFYSQVNCFDTFNDLITKYWRFDGWEKKQNLYLEWITLHCSCQI